MEDKFMKFVHHRPHLVHVNFDSVQFVTNNVITFLGLACPKLHTLGITRCGFVTSYAGRALPLFKSLKRVHSENIDAAFNVPSFGCPPGFTTNDSVSKYSDAGAPTWCRSYVRFE